MAVLKINGNPGDRSASITVAGVVCGGITMTGPATYTANTDGKIAAIDGLNGPSLRDASAAVVARVKAGDVVYHSTALEIDGDDNDAGDDGEP